MNRMTGLLAAFISLVLLGACASHPTKVDCEGQLTPINLPPPGSSAKDTHP